MNIGAGTECLFRQISVSAGAPGTIDNYAFNLRTDGSGRSDLLLFHLAPLVGNFFLVTRDGQLQAAFYRARGTYYVAIPVADADAAFSASLRFWRENLQNLKESIARGELPRR